MVRRLLLLALAAGALVAACALAAGAWTWQAHRHSGRLDFEGYHLPLHAPTEFFRGVTNLARIQTIVGGAPQLNFFNSFLFDADDEGPGGRRLERLEARLLLPMDTWADVVVRQTPEGRVVLRLSRALDLPSGWYLYRGDRCVAHEPIDTSDAVPPGTVADVRLRSDIKNFSVRHLNQAIPLIDREFDTREVDVTLSMEGGRFEATLNGESLGSLDLSDLPPAPYSDVTAEDRSLERWARGHCGVQGSDLPPVRVDRMAVSGTEADGSPLHIEVSFDLPPLTLEGLIERGLPWFLWFIGVAAGLVILFRLGVRGGSLAGLALGVAVAHLFVVGLTLWAEWRHLISFGERLPDWRIGGWVLLGLIYLLILLRHRSHLRLRPMSSDARPVALLLQVVCALGAAVMIGCLGASLVVLQWPEPRPDTVREVADLKPHRWTSDRGVHVPLVGLGRAALAASAEFTVTLESDDAAVEMYFNRRATGRAGVPRWSALRLTPEGAGITHSLGLERPLREPGLAIGEEHRVSVALAGGELTATVRGADGQLVARVAHRSHWREAGAVGLVGRGGEGTLSRTTSEAETVLRSHIERLTLRRSAGRLPELLLAATLALAVFLALAMGLISIWVGGARGLGPLLWSVITATMGGLAAWGLWHLEQGGALKRSNWLAGVVPLAPATIVTALWYLFWIANSELLRRRHLVSLLFLAALIAQAEGLARVSAKRADWRTRVEPGPIGREFVFVDYTQPLIWPHVTGERNFAGVPFPQTEGEERRVFCLGGSATWGAGATDPAEAYPLLLQGRLRDETGDPRWTVYNAGMPTFTVVDDLLRWRREIRRLDPECLILYVGGNDQIATHSPARRHVEIWEMVNRLSEPTLGNRLRLAVMHSHALVGAASALREVRGRDVREFVERVPPRDFESVLRELIEEALADGVRVILAPEVIVECQTQPETHSMIRHHAVLARLAEDFDLPLADTVTPFRERRLDALMVDYIHPNARGNRLLVDAVLPLVLDTAETDATPR